jgi:hypothetical protein
VRARPTARATAPASLPARAAPRAARRPPPTARHAPLPRARAGASGRLLRSLLSTQATGVAPLFILLNAAAAAVLVWMPYTLLVEFSMLLSVPSILLFMWSFVALRVQRPYVPRPFLIPGGLPVAVLLTVVPVAISISYGAIIMTESSFLDAPADGSDEKRSRSSDGGMPPIFQVISMGAVIGVGLAVHGAVALLGRRAPPAAAPLVGLFGATPQRLPASVVAVRDRGALPTHEAEELEAFNGHGALDGGALGGGEGAGGRGGSGGGQPLTDKVRTAVTSAISGGQSKRGYQQVGHADPYTPGL